VSRVSALVGEVFGLRRDNLEPFALHLTPVGKGAIHLARVYGERKRNFVGQHFWARGYFVSTVGRDEAVVREYIKKQEKEDERLDQLGLWR